MYKYTNTNLFMLQNSKKAAKSGLFGKNAGSLGECCDKNITRNEHFGGKITEAQYEKIHVHCIVDETYKNNERHIESSCLNETRAHNISNTGPGLNHIQFKNTSNISPVAILNVVSSTDALQTQSPIADDAQIHISTREEYRSSCVIYRVREVIVHDFRHSRTKRVRIALAFGLLSLLAILSLLLLLLNILFTIGWFENTVSLLSIHCLAWLVVFWVTLSLDFRKIGYVPLKRLLLTCAGFILGTCLLLILIIVRWLYNVDLQM